MIVPVTKQPNIGDGLDDKTSISLDLFKTILETARSHDKLHRSWEVISRDVRIHEKWEAQQRLPINQPPH